MKLDTKELRLKIFEVGKDCLAAAKATNEPITDDLGSGLVELHGCVEQLLDLVEDVEATIEARVVLALAKLRAEGKL